MGQHQTNKHTNKQVKLKLSPPPKKKGGGGRKGGINKFLLPNNEDMSCHVGTIKSVEQKNRRNNQIGKTKRNTGTMKSEEQNKHRISEISRTGKDKTNNNNIFLVSWYFKPSQLQRIISGLKETFIKR